MNADEQNSKSPWLLGWCELSVGENLYIYGSEEATRNVKEALMAGADKAWQAIPDNWAKINGQMRILIEAGIGDVGDVLYRAVEP